MLFNSTEFLFVFLPVVLLLFFVLANINPRWSIISLTLASLVFYAWWDWHFLPILMVSIIANYLIGWAISAHPKQSKNLLILGIALNLSALVFYKYLTLLITSMNSVLGLNLAEPNALLPLGISFFTFTQIAWLVDTWQRKATDRDPLNYLLFVTYFPHLIAGPILHHAQMMPQFSNRKIFTPRAEAFAIGLTFLTIGLTKKVFLADYLANFSSPIFDQSKSGTVSLQDAWLGAMAYSLQLYFDFSGYCDMAIGISRMFNINLPLNFSSPYQSISISEFWRRWHMTLSQFLRDYLYIPLGGNRFGTIRRYTNLMLTMLLGGIWHGANWTFLIWGALHGAYLVIQHLFSYYRELFGIRPLPKFIALALTLLVVILAWVPFRAPDLDSTIRIWSAMLGLSTADLYIADFDSGKGLRAVAIGWIIVIFMPNSQAIAERLTVLLQKNLSSAYALAGIGVCLGLLFSMLILSLGHVSEFLYFQF